LRERDKQKEKEKDKDIEKNLTINVNINNEKDIEKDKLTDKNSLIGNKTPNINSIDIECNINYKRNNFNENNEVLIKKNSDILSEDTKKESKNSIKELIKEIKVIDPHLKIFENKVKGNGDYLKYTDKSFDDYVEDQIKMNPKGKESKTKILTIEVAKYFLAKIPNNYFDAMQIVSLTSELIYESPQITEWNKYEILKWFECLGLENYSSNIKKNPINGIILLKMNVSDYNDILGIKNIKDIKLLMKSIDFLRIFIKLKLDYHDYLEYENHERENDSNFNSNNNNNNNEINSNNNNLNLIGNGNGNTNTNRDSNNSCSKNFLNNNFNNEEFQQKNKYSKEGKNLLI
jgi:hypothetical protein